MFILLAQADSFLACKTGTLKFHKQSIFSVILSSSVTQQSLQIGVTWWLQLSQQLLGEKHFFFYISFWLNVKIKYSPQQPSEWSKQMFTEPEGNTEGPQICWHIILVEKLGGGSLE